MALFRCSWNLNKDDLVMLVDRDAHEIVTCDKMEKFFSVWVKGISLILILHLIIPPILLNLQMVIFMFQMDMEIQMSIVFHLMEHISFSWGSQGSGPGEFTTPHAIWVDNLDRILVADRENNRIQIFESNGRYINSWYDFYHPMDIFGDVEEIFT